MHRNRSPRKVAAVAPMVRVAHAVADVVVAAAADVVEKAPACPCRAQRVEKVRQDQTASACSTVTAHRKATVPLASERRNRTTKPQRSRSTFRRRLRRRSLVRQWCGRHRPAPLKQPPAAMARNSSPFLSAARSKDRAASRARPARPDLSPVRSLPHPRSRDRARSSSPPRA